MDDFKKRSEKETNCLTLCCAAEVMYVLMISKAVVTNSSQAFNTLLYIYTRL
jgi:hypothetical protein